MIGLVPKPKMVLKFVIAVASLIPTDASVSLLIPVKVICAITALNVTSILISPSVVLELINVVAVGVDGKYNKSPNFKS